MRTISKGTEPSSLTDWKRANPHGRYNQLTEDIRRTIRENALAKQFYLCAYCCQRIQDIEACHNEHIEARKLNPRRTLDFSNIVASCNTSNQCGDAHKSQPPQGQMEPFTSVVINILRSWLHSPK